MPRHKAKSKRARKPAAKPAAPKNMEAAQASAPHKQAGGASKGIGKLAFTLRLEQASVFYLALPLAIFLLGFVQPLWGIPVLFSLGAALWFYFKNRGDDPTGSVLIPQGIIPVGHILLCFAASIALVSLLGAGGWGHQTWDWHKHNSMLTHLSSEPWPIVIDVGTEAFKKYNPDWAITDTSGESRFPLVYYIACHLPAGAIGKWLGFAAANHFMFLWTAFGVFLALLWVFVFSRTTAGWIIPLFFFFSGLDLIGALWFPEKTFGFRGNAFTYHLEWWKNDHLTSTMAGIAWVPQHTLPIWLLGGLLLKNIATGGGGWVRCGLLLIALGLLWSTLSIVGFALFMAAFYLVQNCRRGFGTALVGSARAAFSPENLLALPALVLCYLYFAAHTGSFGDILQMNFSAKEFSAFFVEIGLEFLILWGVVLFADTFLRRYAASSQPLLEGDFRLLFFTALLCIAAFFFFKHYDLQKNTSHLPLFILMLATVRLLELAQRVNIREYHRIAGFAVMLLLIGAWSPVVELNRSFADMQKRGAWHKPVQQSSVMNDNQGHTWKYLGTLDSPFYKYFARHTAADG